MGVEEYLYGGAADKALGLLNSAYGYVGVGYTGASTEIYTFRQDTATGTIVRVITVDYTDATKGSLNSATRTA